MLKISQEKFEDLVREGVEEIPEKFLKKLKNVEICVEDKASVFQLEKLKMNDNSIIFGLYEGVPQIKRGNYAQNLPDKITIFREPIERVAETEKQIKEIIKNTVWHEIAHHFGLNENEVRKAEEERARKNLN